MTVRVERLETTAPSPFALATLRILAAASSAVVGWWRRPATLSMSDDWLSEHARSASYRYPD